MFARVLLWLGTLHGLFAGLAMMANSVAGGSGMSAPVRVGQGLIGIRAGRPMTVASPRCRCRIGLEIAGMRLLTF